MRGMTGFVGGKLCTNAGLLAVAVVIASGCGEDADRQGPDGAVDGTTPDGGASDGADVDSGGASTDGMVGRSDLERWIVLLDRGDRHDLTDPDGTHLAALVERGEELLATSQGVEIAVVSFGARIEAIPFTHDPSDFMKAVMTEAGLEEASDLQSALVQATALVEADRTRGFDGSYGVLLLMDGTPTPRCTMGCEDDPTTCMDETDNDGDGDVDASDADCAGADQTPDGRHAICNSEEAPSADTYLDWPGMCPSYNTAPLLISRMRQLVMAIGGDGEMHARLFAPDPPPADLRRDLDDAEALMRALSPTSLARVTPDALRGSLPF